MLDPREGEAHGPLSDRLRRTFGRDVGDWPAHRAPETREPDGSEELHRLGAPYGRRAQR